MNTCTHLSGDSPLESKQCPAASESCSSLTSKSAVRVFIEINDVSSYLKREKRGSLLLYHFISNFLFTHTSKVFKLLLMTSSVVNTWVVKTFPESAILNIKGSF